MSTIKEHLEAIAKGVDVPNSIKHALSEFVYAKWMTADGVFVDEMQEMMCQNLVDVIETIASQGHSGFSGAYLIKYLPTLLKQEPITPLTGEEDEWAKVEEDMYQNKRCSRVIKRGETGAAFDVESRVYYENEIDEHGKERRVFFIKAPHKPITFPYTPTTEYIPANQEEEDS